MPAIQAASLPGPVCTKLEPDNVRSLPRTWHEDPGILLGVNSETNYFENGPSSQVAVPRLWKRHTHSSGIMASLCCGYFSEATPTRQIVAATLSGAAAERHGKALATRRHLRKYVPALVPDRHQPVWQRLNLEVRRRWRSRC